MVKSEFYRAFLGKVIKRMFTLGILFVGLFLGFWYLLDGFLVWGNILDVVFRLTSFVFDISFDPSGGLDNAAFIYKVELGGVLQDVGYKLNPLSSNLVVLVLILGAWPHPNFKAFAKFACWSLFFTLLYQVFSTWLQLHYVSMNPNTADRFGLYWEDTSWYRVMDKLAGFDKFILRYFAAFPLVGIALIARYFFDDFLETRRIQGAKREPENRKSAKRR